jgi:hypothetical protein
VIPISELQKGTTKANNNITQNPSDTKLGNTGGISLVDNMGGISL